MESQKPPCTGHNDAHIKGQPRGNRLFSCLLIAALFVLVDIAIILYVMRPFSDNGDTAPLPDPPGSEQAVSNE
jgi:hypothetical protein